MAHPYKSAGHKHDPKWLDGVRGFADGGRTKDWAVTTSSNSQSDVDAQHSAAEKKQLAPMSQQEFSDGSRGPLNITPGNIPLDFSRKRGGRVR